MTSAVNLQGGMRRSAVVCVPLVLLALWALAGVADAAHPPGFTSPHSFKKIRIVGGRSAATAPFRTAGVALFDSSDSFCTAVLISRRWAITAAHCLLSNSSETVSTLSDPSQSTLFYGCKGGEAFRHDPDGIKLVAYETCKWAKVKRAIPHPCYEVPACECRNEGLSFHDDFALLELETDADVTDEDLLRVDGLQGSAGIDIRGTIPETHVTIVGFGLTKMGPDGEEKLATHMRTLDAPLTSETACRAANPYSATQGLIDYTNTLCAGGASGQSSCLGDSGGPVVARREDGTMWVVGLTFKGSQLPYADQSCGADGRLSMSTMTHGYGAWIQSVMTSGTGGCDQCPCYAEATFNFNPIPLLSAGVRVGGASSPLTLCLGVLAAFVSLAASHRFL